MFPPGGVPNLAPLPPVHRKLAAQSPAPRTSDINRFYNFERVALLSSFGFMGWLYLVQILVQLRERDVVLPSMVREKGLFEMTVGSEGVVVQL